VLTDLGWVHLQIGDASGARPLLEEGMALARALDGWPPLYYSLHNLALMWRELSQPDRALACSGEALHLARARGDRVFTSILLRFRGRLLLELGDLAAARTCLEESLIDQSAQNVGPALCFLAGLAVAEGDLVDAFRLAGAAIGVREAVRTRLTPDNLPWLERRLEPARQALGGEAAAAAWAAGASMTLDDAVSYALRRPPTTAERAPVADAR
jgi:hypothetical protein